MNTSKDSKYGNLNDTLGAIGKAVFVNYYYDFKNTALSMEELSEKLAQTNPGSRSSRQGFRIPRARHIFETNQQLEALRIIIDSERVDVSAREKAKELLACEIDEVSSYRMDVIDEKSFISEIGNGFFLPETLIKYDNSPKKPKERVENSSKRYKRDKQVAIRALAMAEYKCEVDPSHKTFIRKNCNCNYTEPHHLIPLSASKFFPDIDLDREQNVVSLCSHCHNLLHYGKNIDIELKKLYDDRKELLKAIGADISFETLKSFY